MKVLPEPLLERMIILYFFLSGSESTCSNTGGDDKRLLLDTSGLSLVGASQEFDDFGVDLEILPLSGALHVCFPLHLLFKLL